MKLPDQPSFVLPAESRREPARYGVNGPPRRSGEVEQSAPAYRQTAPKAETRKA
jgi:hypothetical protein